MSTRRRYSGLIRGKRCTRYGDASLKPECSDSEFSESGAKLLALLWRDVVGRSRTVGGALAGFFFVGPAFALATIAGLVRRDGGEAWANRLLGDEDAIA